ncbi:Protein kinase-like domain [Pseudocohnilembus persalinus]|uniref:Protein kinase-like domain n=1 Tax=Pseudocohnilembus persalinus TaxID=266149 RepID=A0A0V0R6H4_PSEPJ|nr:Protein kinase-like domain [Pseudocohnilembus persalinus]|eukprot:KRX10097.1 Protein kinase-like domain [Pseudocohnilembus persalinus]
MGQEQSAIIGYDESIKQQFTFMKKLEQDPIYEKIDVYKQINTQKEIALKDVQILNSYHLEKTCQLYQKRIKLQHSNLLKLYVPALSYMQKNHLPHCDIRPGRILLSRDYKYKVFEKQLLTQKSAFSEICLNFNDQQFLQDKNFYLSPQLVQAIIVNDWIPNQNQYKSDVFSLGMTILHMINLSGLENVYNYKDANINKKIIEKHISRVQKQFSKQFYNLVDQMLQYSEDTRPDFQELEILLNQYDQHVPSEQSPNQSPKNLNQNNKQQINLQSENCQTGLNNKMDKKINIDNLDDNIENQVDTQYSPNHLRICQKQINEIPIINKRSDKYFQNEVVTKNVQNTVIQNMNKNEHQSQQNQLNVNNKYQFIANQENINQTTISKYQQQYHLSQIKTGNMTQKENFTNLKNFSGFNQQLEIQPFNDVLSTPKTKQQKKQYSNQKQYQVKCNNKDSKPVILKDYHINIPSACKQQNNFQIFYKNYEEQKQGLNKQLQNGQISNREKLNNLKKQMQNNSNEKIISRQTLGANSDSQSHKSNLETSTTQSQSSKIEVQTYNISQEYKSQKNNNFQENQNINYSNLNDSCNNQNNNLNNNYNNQNIINNNEKNNNYNDKYSINNQNDNNKNKQCQDVQYFYHEQDFPNGSKYQGQIKNNMRNGQGKFYFQDGGLYEGQWKDNKMDGKGILYYQNGQKAYDGQWKDDMFNGYATLFNENPQNSDTNINYKNFDQIGNCWNKYLGHFENDLKHGQGTLYFTNGEFFQGQFYHNKIDGNGIFYTYRGNIIKGKWKDNRLIQQDQ